MLLSLATTSLSLFVTNASAMQWQEEPYFIGEWQLWFGTSNLDDSEGMVATIWDDWRAHNSSNWAVSVGCVEGRPSVQFLMTQEGEFIEGVQVPVSYRLDKNPAKSQDWIVTVSSQSIVIEGERALSFLSELNEADELFIRAQPVNLDDRDARFLLLGVREVVYQAFKLCPSGN